MQRAPAREMGLRVGGFPKKGIPNVYLGRARLSDLWATRQLPPPAHIPPRPYVREVCGVIYKIDGLSIPGEFSHSPVAVIAYAMNG